MRAELNAEQLRLSEKEELTIFTLYFIFFTFDILPLC